MKLVCTLALTGLATVLVTTSAFAQDVLRTRLNADIRSLDPGVNRDANTDAVQAHIFEGLVAFKEDASVGPLLAKTINVSPDGKTYTFTLRDGLKFSNGEPVTSEDVLFSWKRYTDPATGWRCLSEVDGRGAVKVTSVTAKDDRTVVFTTDKPSALFLVTLARPDCGSTGIFHKSSLGPDGKWKEPVATGPFKLGEWRRGQYIELLRNEDYVALPGARDGLAGNKTAVVPKVRFVIIPDEATTKAALVAGDIDIDFDIENSDIEELKANKDLVLSSNSTMGVNALLFQINDPLVSDRRFREALLLSLDMEELVGQTTEGQSKPNNSPIPTPSAYHGPVQSEVSKRDLVKAKALLVEINYKGEPVKIATNKRYQSMFNQAVVAQSMAREAGINLQLDVVDWGAQQDRYLAGNFQMMSQSYSARLDPSLSFEMFSGVKAEQPRKVWENKEALDLLAKTMEISDKTERQALLDRMEKLFRADIPMIVLYSENRTSAARANVQGYKGWALGQPRLWGVSFKR